MKASVFAKLSIVTILLCVIRNNNENKNNASYPSVFRFTRDLPGRRL